MTDAEHTRQSQDRHQQEVLDPEQRRNDSPSRNEKRESRSRSGGRGRSPNQGSRRNSPRGYDRSGDERPAADVFQVYVGGISKDVRQADLEDLFSKFNPILQETQMKGKYAFVGFSSQREADDAVAEFNGTTFRGSQISVEFASKSNTN